VRDKRKEARLANAMHTLPVIRPPIPTLCGLFELASEIDNESYDFYKLLISDLMNGWRSL
jgi:phospholipase C